MTPERQALMLGLLKAQRETSDPDAMMLAAAAAVGRNLGIDRCGFFELRDEDTITFTVGWSSGRLPALTGTFPAIGIGSLYLKEIRAGKVIPVRDLRTDPLTVDSAFASIGTVSGMGVPIFRNGRWRAGFYAGHGEVRDWPEDQVEFVRDIGEQTWDAVERARAVAALKKSEERLTFALEAADGVGTYDWDIPTDRLYCNARFARLFGVDPARAAEGEPIGTFFLGIHPDDRARVGESVQRAVDTGGDFAEEYRTVQPDGTVTWIYSRGRAHLDSGGKPSRFPGVVFDITERKATEFRLLQQWHMFDTALSYTPDFTYIFDLDGRFTYVNRALLSLLQKTLEEAVGKNFFDLEYPAPLAGRLQDQIQQVIATKQPLRDNTPFTGPTGETRQYEYIFVPIFSADGSVEAVAGSTRDITERSRSEELVKEDRRRWREVLMQAPAAIAVLRGPDHRFEWVNTAGVLIVGRSGAEQLLGKTVREALPELLAQGYLQMLDGVYRTGEPFVAHESLAILGETDPRQEVFVDLVCLPTRNADGVINGTFVHATDITNYIRARKQIEEQEQALRKTNRELEEFAYVASHDLQEPLRMVNIYSQLLVESIGQQDADVDQYAAFIRQGTARMEALIQDLLTFSRTVHSEEVSSGTADLEAALAEARSVLKARIEENRASIIAPELPAVRGDTRQLAHVLQNLLANALKYRKKESPPEVIISVTHEGDQWTIAVADNGIGFDQQYSERIFGLFRRLHKDEYPGTGLGLAICKRIVERYGGRMWAEGRPGRGATFYFSLPAAAATPTRPPLDARATQSG